MWIILLSRQRSTLLAYSTCVAYFFGAVLLVSVPFPFGVCGGQWNSIVSVPGHCLSFYFIHYMAYIMQRNATNCDRPSKDIGFLQIMSSEGQICCCRKDQNNTLRKQAAYHTSI